MCEYNLKMIVSENKKSLKLWLYKVNKVKNVKCAQMVDSYFSDSSRLYPKY